MARVPGQARDSCSKPYNFGLNRTSPPRGPPYRDWLTRGVAGAWTQYEVTAQVPADASLVRFGVFMNGGGQVEFRHPALAPYLAGQQ